MSSVAAPKRVVWCWRPLRRGQSIQSRKVGAGVCGDAHPLTVASNAAVSFLALKNILLCKVNLVRVITVSYLVV